MSFLRAPMAFRTPISRVRSVTLTSMIFITPTPPTTRPTLEIANMPMKSAPVSWFHTSEIESEVITAKLSGLSNATLRRRRSNSRISSIAFGISSCEVALMLITCCFISGCRALKVLSGRMTRLSLGSLPPPKTDLIFVTVPITSNNWPSMLISLPSGS